MADDMMGLMDRLMIDKAVVLGASSGGFIARELVLRYPERFVGLIQMGSPLQHKGNPLFQQMYDTIISKFGDEVDPDFIGEFVSGLSGTQLSHWFTGMMAEETMKVPSWVWKEYTASLLTEGIPDNLRAIIVPCLIIWGGQDGITLRSDQEEASSLISGSRLAIHEDLGHMLYWEDPEAVAEDINGFMKEIEKAGVTRP